MKNINTTQVVKLVIIFIGGIIALNFLKKTITVIPAGTVGIKEVFGKVADNPLNPGLHLVNRCMKL